MPFYLISAAGIHEKTEKNKGTVKNTGRVAEYSEAKSKPFAGKVFYLDLPYKKVAEALEKDIQEFGGVSDFLNTCITLLYTIVFLDYTK